MVSSAEKATTIQQLLTTFTTGSQSKTTTGTIKQREESERDRLRAERVGSAIPLFYYRQYRISQDDSTNTSQPLPHPFSTSPLPNILLIPHQALRSKYSFSSVKFRFRAVIHRVSRPVSRSTLLGRQERNYSFSFGFVGKSDNHVAYRVACLQGIAQFFQQSGSQVVQFFQEVISKVSG